MQDTDMVNQNVNQNKMEAKLIKTKTGFYLWRNPLDKSQELLGATVPIMNDNGVDLREYKLSLKNCQAIENGYDLDELALKFMIDESYGEQSTDLWKGYLFGFQKALSILGDKKFSDEDVLNLIKRSREKTPYNFDGKSTEYKFSEDELIQSLQQTEWDVEVVEVENNEVYSFSDTMKVAHNKAFDGVLFKYDADGCLILRKI